MDMQSFLGKAGVTMDAEWTDSNPNMGADTVADRTWHATASHWRIRFRRKDGRRARSLSTYFSQGSAHTEAPTAPEVMDCLASDASSVQNADSFEEWAAEFGYDTDSRRAERLYKLCERGAVRLRAFLGAELYAELLNETERL